MTIREELGPHAEAIEVQPLLYGVEQSTRLIGVSRDMIYRLIRSGELQMVKIGRRTLITAASIHALAGLRRALAWLHRQCNSTGEHLCEGNKPEVVGCRPASCDDLANRSFHRPTTPAPGHGP